MKNYLTFKSGIFYCFLLLLFQLVASLVNGFILIKLFGNSDTITTMLLLISDIFSFGLIFAIIINKIKKPITEIFLLKKVSVVLIIYTTLVFIGFTIVLSEIDNLLNLILPMPEFLKKIFADSISNKSVALCIIVVGIIAPVFEEFFFRGLLLNGFVNNYSIRKSIILSSLLFGLVHLNPWQFVSALIIGIFLGWIYLRTKSLLLNIYFHVIFNSFSLINYYFKVIKIPGFNSDFSVGKTFQPLWFNLLGIVLSILGIYLITVNLRTYKLNKEPDI
jgi:membrane protease YdiL (CAAX protease family)